MGQKKIRGWPPWAFLVIDILWIVILLLVMFGLAAHWSWLARIHDPFGGVVPFAVPWAGALGGVAISLVGIAHHQLDWDPERYAYWHLVRPLLGSIFGTVAVLIIVLVLNSVKVTQAAQGRYPPVGIAVLAVIAFVVGYREATFRSLVARVVDVILAPGAAGAASPLALVPSLLDFGSVAQGAHSPPLAVHLFNATSDTVRIVPGNVTVDDASVSVAAFSPQDLKPSESCAFELTWAPRASQTALDANLRVAVSNTVVAARLTGTSP